MFSKIDTVHILVRDLEKAHHWYEEILELEQVFNSGKYLVFKIGVGESTLTIQAGEVRPSSIKPILFSDALEETQLKLLEKGVEVGKIKEDEDVTYFEFYDLDGNGFEVCEYIPL
ncbi:VOC family protein [Rossellomorea aquimaris]|uniref:VOC family protein n=1 Tax=Rossellomorea aquimaris TaxID=189382 RepID=UPI001CD34151|nr:VOC family protein [Rossellomorea aquimaris]MCA1058544.1 VOC family protein [Rossellomorea aquimaris]